MVPLNAPTVRQLALIKYMFMEGLSNSRKPSPLFVTALLAFQDAAESFLHLACVHHQIPVKKQMQFMEYWDALKPVGPVGHHPGMDRLNKARVAFKHHGNLPNEHDMEFFRVTAKSFFDENSPALFGIEFDAVSLVDLVQPEDAKARLRDAERAWAAKSLPDAYANLRMAYDQLLTAYRTSKRDGFGRDAFDFGPSFTFSRPRTGVRDLDTFLEDSRDGIRALRRIVEALAFGLDYRKLARFRMLTPPVQWTASNEPFIAHSRNVYSDTPSDFDFCREFVIECAVRLQEFDFSIAPGRS
jgi:hypothetical protein